MNAATPNREKDFIEAWTAVSSPPQIPEIRLYLASEITPIWEATEAILAREEVPPPFWAFAWPGGQALARYILDHPEIVRGRTVLDFAGGCGLIAIAAAKSGAKSVTCADIDPFALAATRLNAELNKVTVAFEESDLVGKENRGWDVVLSGDICYEKPLAERVTTWLRTLAGGGAVVMIGDPGRDYLPKEGLVEVTRYTVPTSLELEDRLTREAIIWRILP
ncbi:MAG: methyltransferase [Rhodospirillaceae bacterium]|nr:methyltransferase [Rhodospirillaceae bacterium]MBT5374416.1 methyltransferase [Rhodospirillaceae bacterium]MBT5659369.1 methyltransferase [Rhodospirillaceae bacterium]MBT5751897.1 methyltransferase [Rhodospirillaceae bacterium]